MKHVARASILAILSSLMVSACISVPEQLKGEYMALTPESATEKHIGTPVRWGGVILETRPVANHTCFEILARQLEKSMRPAKTDQSSGRFIACKTGFFDPEVFEKGREVTATGKLVHIDTRKVGEYDYHFPVLDIEFMSLWPVRRNRVYYRAYPPYYWHYPHYGFYYRYPY